MDNILPETVVILKDANLVYINPSPVLKGNTNHSVASSYYLVTSVICKGKLFVTSVGKCKCDSLTPTLVNQVRYMPLEDEEAKSIINSISEMPKEGTTTGICNWLVAKEESGYSLVDVSYEWDQQYSRDMFKAVYNLDAVEIFVDALLSKGMISAQGSLLAVPPTTMYLERMFFYTPIDAPLAKFDCSKWQSIESVKEVACSFTVGEKVPKASNMCQSICSVYLANGNCAKLEEDVATVISMEELVIDMDYSSIRHFHSQKIDVCASAMDRQGFHIRFITVALGWTATAFIRKGELLCIFPRISIHENELMKWDAERMKRFTNYGIPSADQEWNGPDEHDPDYLQIVKCNFCSVLTF